jgi:paraquat-inducible protein B
MAKRINPSVLGGFVLGGIVLVIAALFLFGGGEFFKEKTVWVTYFRGSVGGLSDGAPVTFRGVPVGKVTKVAVQVDAKELTARIPVYFQIDRSRITWAGGIQVPQDPKLAIRAGLRTKLATQSLVTGQMMIELDLLPRSPAVLTGADPNTPELPSVESEIDVLKQQLSNLPVRELLADIDRAVNNLNHIVESPDVGRGVKEMADTMAETRELLANINGQAGPLLQELTDAARSSRQTLGQATDTLRSFQTEGTATLGDVRKLTSNGGRTLDDLKTTLQTADAALAQARDTMASVDGLVAQDTTTRNDIDGTLANLNRASAALRSFANTLDHNPNAVIVGK